MRFCLDIFKHLKPRRSLYRVWVTVVEGDRARLVARWINPEAKSGVGDAAEEAPAMTDVEARWRSRYAFARAA